MFLFFSVCTLGLEVVKVFQGGWREGRVQIPLQPSSSPPNKTYCVPRVYHRVILVTGDGATYSDNTHWSLVGRQVNDRTLVCRQITTEPV